MAQLWEIKPEFRDLIPPPTAEEREALKASIERDGIRDTITVWAGRGIVLDGHTRIEINRELGKADHLIPVERKAFADEAAAQSWMITNQCGRRNLSASQRAMLAAKLATLKRGDNQHTQKEDASNEATSQSDAADKLDVSRSTVQRAAKVLSEGIPEVSDAVTRGDVSVSVACAAVDKMTPEEKAELRELPKAEQADAIKKAAKREAAKPAPYAPVGKSIARQALAMLAKIPQGDAELASAVNMMQDWCDATADGLEG